MLQCEVLWLLTAEVIFTFKLRPQLGNKEKRKFLRNSLTSFFCKSELYVYCYLYLVKQDLYQCHCKASYITDFCFQLYADYYSIERCSYIFLNDQECILCSTGMTTRISTLKNIPIAQSHVLPMAEEPRAVLIQKISVFLRQLFMHYFIVD